MLLTAALLFGSTAISVAVPFDYTGAELKKNMKISLAAVQKTADALAIKTVAANKSALYQQKLSWQTSDIKQIIVTARADKAGQLRFASNTLADGKKASVNIYLPVAGDGEFHDYIFDVAENKNWKGVLTNYELRWFGPADTLLEIKKIAASDKAVIKLAGNSLKSKVKLFKAIDLKKDNAFAAKTTGAFGGFHQQKLAWNANEINTVSFMLKSDKPDTLRYACSLKNAPVTSIAFPVQKVPGDNQYHVYKFNLASHPKFAGIQTNYELRFTGEKGATIELKEMTAEKSYAAKEVSPAPVKAVKAAPAAAATFSGSELAGAVLRKYVHPFRLQPVKRADGVAGKSTRNNVGGFYQADLAYDTNKYKQVEFTLAADEPGYWNLAVSCTQNGKRATASAAPAAAVPDGKYHTYIYTVSDSINWKGIATNWEIRFLGGEPANLAIKEVRWVAKPNLIANADRLPVNKEVITGKLMPRAQCQLNWLNGTCPGAVIRFYDRNFKEIPNSAVELKAGAKSVVFTTPEMQVEPRITIRGKADGYPQLLQLSYLPPRETGHTLPWRGKWLWGKNAPSFINHSIWFERKITLDAAPDFAVFSAVGDDSCFTYVNGKHVGKTRGFSSTGRYDITKYLKKGVNTISCRVKNIDSWGGFIAMGYAEVGGKTIYFDSDEKWTMDTKSNTDRYIPECKEPALVIGEPSMNPWRARMGYRHTGKQGVFSLIKSEKGKMTVKVESLPITEIKRLRFELVRSNGTKHDFMLNITPGSKEWKVGEKIEVAKNKLYWNFLSS